MTQPSLPRASTPSHRAPATQVVCPFLLASDGRWRSAAPAREHRCTAVSPPAILAADKQRRLCLTAEHSACATYRVATDHVDTGEDPAPRRSSEARTSARDLVRTAPLVLDHGRLPVNVTAVAVAAERGLGQVALLILLAVAFVAILIARLSSSADPGGVVGGGATPSPAHSASPAASSTPTLSPTPTDPGPSVAASDIPSGSGAPAETPGATDVPTTYKVRSGDTLSGIAGRFGTTVTALTELNGIKDASQLQIGQVLKLP